MQTFTYEGIREKALKQGITDNRLRVGLWASSNGYIKKQKERYKERLSQSIQYPKCNLTKIYMKCQILVFQSVRYSRIIY